MSGLAAVASQRAPALEEGLSRAYQELRRELTGTLYGLLGNDADAQDAAQAAFLNCWQARGGLAGVRDLRAWVFRSAVNAGKDLARNAWRRKRRPLDQAAQDCAGTTASPLELLIGREEVARVAAAVAALRPGEREVFRLRQNQGLTYPEIAVLRGLPVATVKTLMRAALQKLRRHFQDDAA